MCDVSLTEIQEWLESALQNYDLVNFKIEIEGRTDKGDGYGSDITFIKVDGYSKTGDQTTLQLAAKSLLTSEKLREQVSMKDVFLKEIYIYQDVKTTFEKFLCENGLDGINFMPHCYGVHVSDASAALVFDNLRPQGFQLWNKALPMTSKHIELILEAYGRWHGLSVALKTHKPEVFEKLVQNNINMFSRILDELKFDQAMLNEFLNTRSTIIHENEKELETILQYSEDDFKYALRGMFFEDPDYQVILHGDCWNNNFLFKILEDPTNPSEVRILDWQCSGLASPAFDLSHFFYACADSTKYDNINDFLKIYYGYFSKTLRALGCDPEKVFPYDKLVQHWKRFSRFGLFVSCLIVRMCSMSVQDIPDFAETADKGEDLLTKFSFETSNDQNFNQRIRNNYVHYCRNLIQ